MLSHAKLSLTVFPASQKPRYLISLVLRKKISRMQNHTMQILWFFDLKKNLIWPVLSKKKKKSFIYSCKWEIQGVGFASGVADEDSQMMYQGPGFSLSVFQFCIFLLSPASPLMVTRQLLKLKDHIPPRWENSRKERTSLHSVQTKKPRP